MSKKEKLIKKLKSKPKDFTFEELEALLTSLEFKKSDKGRTSGSRAEFENEKLTIQIHKPHPQKELPMYQIIQILKSLEGADLI